MVRRLFDGSEEPLARVPTIPRRLPGAFSRGPAIDRRLPGTVPLRSLDRSLNSHLTNVRGTMPAFDFDSSIPTALFAKAFEEVPPSIDAYPTPKSFSGIRYIQPPRRRFWFGARAPRA